MPQPSIRRAGSADAEAVAAIGAQTFQDTFGHLYPSKDLRRFLETGHSAERAAADLADPARAVWLAEHEGRAVGYALAGPCGLPHPEVTPACGELHRLYLAPAFRADGLGGRLLAEALAWLQRDGPCAVWLGVWSQNFGAQRFYARQGFEKVGEYGFRVGETVDLEFILRRPGGGFSDASPQII